MISIPRCALAVLLFVATTAAGEEIEPLPSSGTYTTDKLGAITVWGLPGEPQSAEKTYSICLHDDVLRLEVHQGDRRRKPSEIKRAIERSEVSFPANGFAFGKTYQLQFEILFERGSLSSAKNDKFFQVHNVNDEGDVALGPVFAMQLEKERMRMVVRWDQNRITTSRVDDHWVFTDSRDIERNRWYRFDIRVRFDPFGDGVLTVQRDGVEVANYSGPLGYNDAKPPYAKVGIYRDSCPEPQARRYRGLTIKRLD
jgi:Polysaccharide lyase